MHPSPVVRCLGVLIDKEVSFRPHVIRVAASCFGALRQIRSVRRSLPRHLIIKLVESLVIPLLDFCISLLAGIPRKLVDRIQSVLNASARLIFDLPRFSSITPIIRELGWLPADVRPLYRLAVLTHSCLHDKAPTYLTNELKLTSTNSRYGLRSSTTNALYGPRVKHPTIGGRSFPSTASSTWNSLPPTIRNISNTGLFKSSVKQHFLSFHFNKQLYPTVQ